MTLESTHAVLRRGYIAAGHGLIDDVVAQQKAGSTICRAQLTAPKKVERLWKRQGAVPI
jgi:hypothetical protein